MKIRIILALKVDPVVQLTPVQFLTTKDELMKTEVKVWGHGHSDDGVSNVL